MAACYRLAFKTFQAMRAREHERERERKARARQEAIELEAIRRAWPRLPGDLRDVVLAIVGEIDVSNEGA